MDIRAFTAKSIKSSYFKSEKVIHIRDVRFFKDHDSNETDSTEPEGIAVFKDDYIINLNIKEAMAVQRSVSTVESANSEHFGHNSGQSAPSTPETPININDDKSINSDDNSVVPGNEPSSPGTLDAYPTPRTEPDMWDAMTVAERAHFKAEGIAPAQGGCIWVNMSNEDSDYNSTSPGDSTSPGSRDP